MTHLHLVQDNTDIPILSSRVPHNRRLPILPTYFPNTFIVVENSVHAFMNRLCKKYSEGSLEFYELSNGGFYMSPDLKELWDVEVPFGNRFKGKMSTDALGITACLYVYVSMADDHPESNFWDHYWHLRNYAYQHKEVAAILNAIRN